MGANSSIEWTDHTLKGGHGFHGEDVRWMRKAGKADAGRVLDGRTWDEFPVVAR